MAGCLAGMILAGDRLGAAPAPPPVPVAQETPWRIVNYSREAGVEQRGVGDLAFEADGTAWFAVTDGLYRYDGYRWRRFTVADGLPSNYVRSVAVLRDGSLWVGTDQGAGVFSQGRFDRRATEGRLAGPSVRRIVETRDGTRWFCCDRWPDATVSGGVTRQRGDEFRSFGVAEGLPSDYVVGMVELPDGRLFALTAKGPALLTGDRFTPQPLPGFRANEYAWNLATNGDGELFAQGLFENRLWRDGVWVPCPGAPGAAPFCVAQDGTLIVADRSQSDRIRFLRWDGQRLVAASRPLPGAGLVAGDMKTAPDGSIWAVGRGTIIRWTYGPSQWQWWPRLASPVLEDRAGRIWFAGADGAAFRTNGSFKSVAGLRAPLAEDAAGHVWGGAQAGVHRWREGVLDHFPSAVSGLNTVEKILAEPGGAVWFAGAGTNDTATVARWENGRWSWPAAGRLDGQELTGFALDPTNGVWMASQDRGSLSFRLLHTAGGPAREVPLASPLKTGWPQLLPIADRLFLYSFNGLWEASYGERLDFREVPGTAGSDYREAARQGDISVFLSPEESGGRAQVLVRRGTNWLSHALRLGDSLSLNPDGWLLIADGSEVVLWQTREWSKPSYLALPPDTVAISQLRTRAGDYWVGTSQGGLQWQDFGHAPETDLSGPGQILSGVGAVARVRGLAKFGLSTEERRHSFAWQLDGGTWSGFGDWPAQGLELGDLPPGPHVLRAQARDGTGKTDPTPAELAFVITPVPIQDQVWFRPTLIIVGGAFALLSFALLAARGKLRRHAHELEDQVARRTVELREDIRQREAAEQELSAREARARRQAAALAALVHGEPETEGVAGVQWNRFTAELVRAAGVARAGVWELSADGSTLRCLSLYAEGTGHSHGQMLAAADHPSYFAALQSDCRIAATEARTDPRTAELVDGYLAPLGITSMLDAGILVGDQLAGVICLEHIGPARSWLSDELAFANAAAALVAQEFAQRGRALAEARLQDERLRLGSIIDAARVGTWAWNVQTGETEFNERWAEIIGYRLADLMPVSIQTWLQHTHPDDLANSKALLDRHFAGELDYYECDCRMRHRDGHWVWIHDRGRIISRSPDGRPLMMFGTHTDVTERHRHEEERQQLQEQLHHSQRLESLGRLAGGVAHEFNNMLQAIRGNTDLALMELAPGHPAHECLREIQESSQRSADISRQLLTFARRQSAVPRVIDLNATVSHGLNLLRRVLGENIALDWQPGAGLWPVEADPGQLEQVLTNLCVNARDAITGQGRICIATRNTTLPNSTVDCPAGDYVLLSVSDTGSGMDAATQARIFEPFFTTKEAGKGTGLGLAIVFGVIRQSHGHISVRSEPGQGTTFEILLPRCHSAPEADSRFPVAAAPVRRGQGTILLVEDEEHVLRVANRLLTQQGYTVLPADTPAAALERATHHRGPIDLLVTDMVMPGMSGLELHQRIQALRPGLRCLFISGYAADNLAGEELPKDFELLLKPFSLEAFGERIRQMLG